METFGPLSFIVLIIALLLAWTLFKPVWDGSELRRGTTVFLITVLVATGVVEARWLYGQHKGSQIIASVSENENGYLECQRISKAFLDTKGTTRAGEVEWNRPDRALMRYQECLDFINWATLPGHKDFTPEVGFAIFVLVHEAMHVKGEQNEAVAECTALQLAPQVMKDLGIDEEAARTYIDDYYANIYPHQKKKYVSPECVDGGELDLYPELDGFPMPYKDQSAVFLVL